MYPKNYPEMPFLSIPINFCLFKDKQKCFIYTSMLRGILIKIHKNIYILKVLLLF